MAAPIAMVGYSLPIVPVTARLPASAVAGPGRRLYRLRTTWVSVAGHTRIQQPPSYVYLTSNPIRQPPNDSAAFEQLPSGARASMCAGYPLRTAGPPFGPARQANLWCWSRTTGMYGEGSWEGLTAQHPGFAVYWSFPMLIAAVDPVAEAKLDGLNRAVTSGRYLRENAGPAVRPGLGGMSSTTFPVLAAARSGIGEYEVTQVQQLARPASPPRLDPAAMRRDATAAGQPVSTVRVTAAQAYQQLLAEMSRHRTPELQSGPGRVLERGADPVPAGRRGQPGGLDHTEPGVGLVIRAARRARAAHGQRRDGLPHRT